MNLLAEVTNDIISLSTRLGISMDAELATLLMVICLAWLALSMLGIVAKVLK